MFSLAISTPNELCNREESCEYVHVWLLMIGVWARWDDIVKEFDSIRDIYQESPRKHFRIPMFEVVNIYKRLAYLNGK